MDDIHPVVRLAINKAIDIYIETEGSPIDWKLSRLEAEEMTHELLFPGSDSGLTDQPVTEDEADYLIRVSRDSVVRVLLERFDK